jgi:hypothetical protein
MRKLAEKPVTRAIKRAAARAGIAPWTPAQELSEELLGMHATLGEVIEHVIGTQYDGEFEKENFVDALVKLRSTRIVLEDEARKLVQQSVVAL